MEPNSDAGERMARIAGHLNPPDLPMNEHGSSSLTSFHCRAKGGAPGFKVAILGAAGGIGQPLSMLMKMNPFVSVLHLYDVVNTPGVTSDISHMDTSAVVRGFLGQNQLEDALTGMDLVIIPAGVPRKPGMTRDDLFNINAGIVKTLCEGIAKRCPKAIVNLISNPVNSTVPIAAEVFKRAGTYDPKRLLGVTMLDVVRANTFVAEVMGLDPRDVDVPVVGGHAGVTILPLLSQVKPPSSFTTKEIEYLTDRIQNGGTEVVEAKAGAGSATLSMAYAAVKFADACLRALKGEAGIIQCAYVDSQVTELPFFASKVRLGERHLIVANEELSSLEDVVRIMPMAQYLNVAFNSLSSLSHLEKMMELRSLDISHNMVESLQEVASLSNLLVLKCSSNHITDLSWIAGLNHLEELWIRENRVVNAQLAHLQQLTALQTLVIHPNPCTERDGYVLTILKVLPWLQRVDTVLVTDELREEARHAEERETLDSGATDCSIFSLSDRSEDLKSNEDCIEDAAATAPAPTEPVKKGKQLTAEEIMRAFPIQEFISLDSNGESMGVLGDHLMNPANEQPHPRPSVVLAEVEDNQNVNTAADQACSSSRSFLLTVGDAQENQPSAEGGLEIKKRPGILDSVLTLPTFDKDSFLQKKKPQPQVPGTTKSKQHAKSKSATTENPNKKLPFHQNEEYTVAYPNSTVTAIQVRCDGSAIARWPSGSVAISVDFENSSDRSGYRVYAAHKDGQLALSFDPAGVGFLNAYPSGKTLLSTTSDGDGLLFDLTTGGIVRQWNSQGKLRDGSCQPVHRLGDEPDGSLLCRLSEHLAVNVCLNSRPDDVKQEASVRLNVITLRIYFAGAPGIRHVFVNSENLAEPCSADSCDYALGKAPSKREIARASKAKTPIEHSDLLSSIRAAVAGL